MLRNRLISAGIIIGCSLVFVLLDAWAENFGCPGIWMLPLGVYLILGSAYECSAMVARSPIGSITRPAMAGCVTIMAATCVPLLWPLSGSAYPASGSLSSLEWALAAASIALLGGFVWHLSSYQPGQGAFQRALLAGWVACYFGISFAFILAVRSVGESSWGLYLLVGFILVTKLSDTGAYFAGRALGRTKLCPRVSPNKTVEGFLGGMLLACLAAWVYFDVCGRWVFGGDRIIVHWQGVLLLGASLTLVGLAGDLLQSVFKREMGFKDSGKLSPGLGGLWDVTDSLLPSAAVGYLIAVGGWVVGPGQ